MESLERTRITTAFVGHPMLFCLMAMYVILTPSIQSAEALTLFRQPSYPGMIHGTIQSKHGTSSMFSDIPRDDMDEAEAYLFQQYVEPLIPPPPEDLFTMAGDVTVLFLYAFTSHYLNNFVVDSVIAHSDSIQDALSTLDPMGEVNRLQQPVWVSVDEYLITQNVLTLAAKENLMNHWGPLFSTAGLASVALCTCWLVAGLWHRAFLFQNSLECEAGSALVKTIETWFSMAFLMILLAMGCNELITFLPAGMVHNALGGSAVDHVDYIMTKADSMLLIDSMTVLIAWRFMANSFMKFFF